MEFGYGDERPYNGTRCNSQLQREKSREICRARNAAHKGKTYEEIYGAEKGAEMRARARERGKAYGDRMRGKTMEQRYGKTRAAQIREKIRNACAGRAVSPLPYITESEKLTEPTWKIMMLPPVRPWRSVAPESLFTDDRDYITPAYGRRW